ncbi:MAG TPA: FecR domain-containing protein, partial [Isosphaeraceae bacterium]|nr:FecR domain-containing protein [Isosphaeraceae bacterium]
MLDEYCNSLIDDDGLRRLEASLLASPEARREFVAYFQLHTELQFAVRARKAADAVMGQVTDDGDSERRNGSLAELSSAERVRRFPVPRMRLSRWQALAAGVFITAVGFLIGQAGRSPTKPPRAASQTPRGSQPLNVAWLINAQDCQWAGDEGDMPGRDMRAGKVLRLKRGLAEIEFERGARVILQGPAGLVLLSGNEARLLHGTITARVPREAIGFAVLSPGGKVVDLGTEFGLTVDEHGATDVRVFEGEVEAATLGVGATAGSSVTLHQDQSGQIDGRTVALRPADARSNAGRFVRQIVPPPVITPKVVKLDFARPVPGTIQDVAGHGIGLTRRLPGTGLDLLERDENLRLNTQRGMLELRTTRSDLNTQSEIRTGEYLGVRLADLGFRGTEDFAISATIPDIPALEKTGQFGLYAGSRSDETIRGGLISGCEPERYELFLVNNDKGIDAPPYYIRLMNTRGDDLRLTLQRTA